MFIDYSGDYNAPDDPNAERKNFDGWSQDYLDGKFDPIKDRHIIRLCKWWLNLNATWEERRKAVRGDRYAKVE